MIPLNKDIKNQLDTETKMEKDMIVFKGSHPDNLYRVGTGSGVGGGKAARALRILRWPAALVLVCVALAVFVYFLMPDNIEANMDRNNASYWEPVAAGAGPQFRNTPTRPDLKPAPVKEKDTTTHTQGTRTSEIDFYDAETDKSFDITSIIDSATETSVKRKLPVQPVFPAHITPEVQYGNEKADSDKLRTAKTLDETNTLPEDSTLKPHITQKPEKPLEIYFKDGNGITTTLSTSETINKAETLNDYTNYGQKYSTKQAEDPSIKPQVNTPVYQEQPAPQPPKSKTAPAPTYEKEPEIPPEIQEFYQRRPSNVDVNFTSGHSKLFGISIEDAEKMRSTTQSSAYNTRVSPTLPTWRDGDDSTTKNYPVNVNYDVPQCRSTRLALCRGVLPYDLAGPAVKVNGLEITSLLPQIEYLVATNCSDRVQQFTCALLEPECNPPPFPTKLPCYNFCKAISDNCEGLIPRELLPAFNCNQYSSANCLGAKAPCHPREMACGDGTCVPRDWICDGASDCPAGEDEAKCVVCETNEYKCPSGGCILKRWMCDGYADCPEGEDEADSACPGSHGQAAAGRAEPGEESAGSAPAPAIRRPFRVPSAKKNKEVAGENDSSKELLITSDSNNALKRNFTRRPSLSRLTPYSRPMLHESRPKQDTEPKEEMQTKPEFRPKEEFRPREEFHPKETSDGENPEPKQTPQFVRKNKDQKTKPVSVEDIGDLSFLEEIEKQREALEKKPAETSKPPVSLQPTAPQETMLTRLDKSLNKLEKAIDGAALLRKAVSQQEPPDSPETNSTTLDKDDSSAGAGNAQQSGMGGWSSAHASPCPSGELRCVDGRCITLAQLCDGTIDCTDHADEDNCYT